MQFSEALKRTGGDSVGGQLIVHKDGVNIFVGRHHDGYLLVEDSDAARAVMADIGHKERTHHEDGAAAEATGRRGRGKARPVEPVVDAAAPEEPDPEDATHHEVVVADETVTADALGGGE